MTFVSIVVTQDNVRALTQFKDHIYWTESTGSSGTGSIYRADKTQGTNQITVIRDLDSPWDIHMYHPDRQAKGLYHLLHHPTLLSHIQ